MSITLDEDVSGGLVSGIKVENLCSDGFIILEKEESNDRNDHWQSEDNDFEKADF